MFREVADRNCVGGISCASARAAGVAFQACSIDHSDIFPFRINHLRAVWNSVAQNPPSNPSDRRWHLDSAVYGLAEVDAPRELCQTL